MTDHIKQRRESVEKAVAAVDVERLLAAVETGWFEPEMIVSGAQLLRLAQLVRAADEMAATVASLSTTLENTRLGREVSDTAIEIVNHNIRELAKILRNNKDNYRKRRFPETNWREGGGT